MKVYHGSTVEVSAPVIIATELGRDFGPAFYTTGVREQAERWAIRRAKLRRKSGEAAAAAIVSEYEFDEVSARRTLKVKTFEGPSLPWLDMVVQCRSRLAYRHGYDIMEGKIANDSVGETVSYVVAGVMPRELALEKLKFQRINGQIAFCTEAALRFLRFGRSYVVGEGEGK